MTTNPVPMPATDPIHDFAQALTSLGNHARQMDTDEVEHHDDCTYCETMVLLARMVDFGEQLRRYERRTATT